MEVEDELETNALSSEVQIPALVSNAICELMNPLSVTSLTSNLDTPGVPIPHLTSGRIIPDRGAARYKTGNSFNVRVLDVNCRIYESNIHMEDRLRVVIIES